MANKIAEVEKLNTLQNRYDISTKYHDRFVPDRRCIATINKSICTITNSKEDNIWKKAFDQWKEKGFSQSFSSLLQNKFAYHLLIYTLV